MRTLFVVTVGWGGSLLSATFAFLHNNFLAVFGSGVAFGVATMLALLVWASNAVKRKEEARLVTA